MLKFFRTNDREDEVTDQADCNDSDNGVDHGMVRLNFFAGQYENCHGSKKADACQDVDYICHLFLFCYLLFILKGSSLIPKLNSSKIRRILA